MIVKHQTHCERDYAGLIEKIPANGLIIPHIQVHINRFRTSSGSILFPLDLGRPCDLLWPIQWSKRGTLRFSNQVLRDHLMESSCHDVKNTGQAQGWERPSGEGPAKPEVILDTPAPRSFPPNTTSYTDGSSRTPAKPSKATVIKRCFKAQYSGVVGYTEKWKWSHSVVSDSLRPHGHQAPPSTGFARQGSWSGLSFPSPGNLPNPGIEPRSPAL